MLQAVGSIFVAIIMIMFMAIGCAGMIAIPAVLIYVMWWHVIPAIIGRGINMANKNAVKSQNEQIPPIQVTAVKTASTIAPGAIAGNKVDPMVKEKAAAQDRHAQALKALENHN